MSSLVKPFLRSSAIRCRSDFVRCVLIAGVSFRPAVFKTQPVEHPAMFHSRSTQNQSHFKREPAPGKSSRNQKPAIEQIGKRTDCMFRTIITLCFLFGVNTAMADDLRVLKPDADGVNPAQRLGAEFSRQSNEYLDARRAKLIALNSRQHCKKWQADRREFFKQQLGKFPARTPLNAKVVRRLDGDGYHVENVIFESRPNHHVTANLYLPDSNGPYPAVLVPCGHSHNGKASGQYQRISILLARNGMAALCYDPVGQGERYQMLDFEHDHERFATVPYLKTPHPRVQYLCTIEHTTMGLGCILLGSNIAQFRVWDGMRAIDYLQSRDDIIPDKIGCTGNSGGGTLTSYLMALDERIAAAAPGCYLTTFRQLIANKGPQDAEQNIFGQIAFGMDEPDYVMMRAPKPTLICAARRDATFDIDGTWDLYRQSKSFYARLGYGDHVEISDTDHPHGFYLPQREAVARFMHRWLLGSEKLIHEVDPNSYPDPITDEQLLKLSEGDWTQEQLYCSPKGQVLLMPNERSVFQINVDYEAKLQEERTAKWKKLDADQRRQLVTTSIETAWKSKVNQGNAPPEYLSTETIKRDGYQIEKIILTSGSTIPLPALAFVPEKPNGQATLYLHGTSMKTDAQPGGPIEKIVKQGQIVFAAELRGIGETENDQKNWGRGRFGEDVQQILLAYLMGQSYVGLRVQDTMAWTSVLSNFRMINDQPNEIHLVAVGEAAIPALHAAALHDEEFDSVRLQKMIRSWSEVVRSPESLNQMANVVHGVLKHYDLSDLIRMIGANKVIVEDSVDASGYKISNALEE